MSEFNKVEKISVPSETAEEKKKVPKKRKEKKEPKNTDDTQFKKAGKEKKDSDGNELRPKSFKDYIGQDHIKEELEIAIQASKMRDDILSHMLFFGAPGLGKTTIATIIAEERGSKLHITTAPIIERPADLAATLMSLEEGDVLFIDEIHALKTKIEESLYSVIEDFRLDIPIDQGGTTRLISLPVKPFTLIAATTRPGAISQPLRDRFSVIHQLKFYNEDELAQILERSARLLNVKLSQGAAMQIAKRSRNTARVANNLLKRLMPYAVVKNKGVLDEKLAEESLNKLNIDKLGLNDVDRKMLHCIHYALENKARGLKTIAPYISEDERTIEFVIEPYLIKKGLLSKTSKGRQLTKFGVQYVIDNIPKDDF